MKKIISFILISAFCLMLVACGESNVSSYTITLTDGTVKEFNSASDVRSAFEENEVVGEELYFGADVEFVDEITEISKFEKETMWGSKIEYASLKFFGSCSVTINISNEENKAIISQLKVGDTVKCVGEIERIFIDLEITGYSIEPYTA